MLGGVQSQQKEHPMSVHFTAVLVQSAVDPTTLTPGRLWASAAALLGLAGAVVGGRALARTGKGGAVTALAAGVVSVVVGGLVVAAAEGGPGTGYGIVGGYAALVVGTVAVALGGLVLTRLRRGSA
jgi:hypothetical protein